MIIYGSKTIHLKSLKSRKATCPNCSNEQTIQFNYYSKHAHVFWLPFFPVGRLGESQCSHCKEVRTYYEMPKEWRKEYKSLKKEAKTPLWQFSGLAILLVIIFGSIAMDKLERSNTEDYFQNPKTGDHYYYLQENGTYSIFRISEIINDTLYTQFNGYYVNKKSDLESIDIEENFEQEQYYLTSSDIDSMYQNQKIVKIIRD